MKYSYGGHYGPAFYDYFYEQNERIISGEIPGTALKMNSLIIINGVVSELIQAPYYPDFAMYVLDSSQARHLCCCLFRLQNFDAAQRQKRVCKQI